MERGLHKMKRLLIFTCCSLLLAEQGSQQQQLMVAQKIAAGGGTVAFDALGPSAAGQTGTNVSTINWNHVVGAGSNRLLLVNVTIGANPDSRTITSVVCSGAAAPCNGGGMTAVAGGLVHANAGTAGYTAAYFLIAPPASSTVTITITLGTSSPSLEGGSLSFTGVDQTTPITNVTTATGTGTAPSVAGTTTATGMAVDALVCGNTISTSSQTNRIKNNSLPASSAAGGASAMSTAAGTGSSVTMAYTISSDDWGVVFMNLVAA